MSCLGLERSGTLSRGRPKLMTGLTFAKDHTMQQVPLFLPRSLVEYIGEMAFPTVLSIVHSSHENTGTTLVEGQLLYESVTKVKDPYLSSRAFSS